MARATDPVTDETLMTFGAHKGKKMANVPADYLIWLYENDKCSQKQREYIEDNLDVLNSQIKRGVKHD